MIITSFDFQSYFELFAKFANENLLLIIIVAFFLAMLEAFLPVLPLVAIVGFNISMFKSIYSSSIGTAFGLSISIIGSFVGTFFVFCIIKFSIGKWFRKKVSSSIKVQSAIEWMINRGDIAMILLLSNPYVPSSIFNYAMALVDFPMKRYLFITGISRIICVSLLAILSIIFDVGEDVWSFVWLTLTYVGIYIVIWLGKKIINYSRRKKDEKENN